MVQGVLMTPVVEGREGQDAGDVAENPVGALVREEAAVAAVVKEDEDADEQAGGNDFPVDGPLWTLTSTTRSWVRDR